MAHGDVARKKKTTRRLPRRERGWGRGARGRVALSVLLALGLMLLAASGAAYASADSTLTSLGMAPWSGPGTPSALSGPRGIGTPLPTATQTPAPTATPRPPATNRQQNDMMGCHSAAPAPLPAVVYSGGYANGRAPAEVALTFDDGPAPSSTVPILDYLERTRTPATFMVIGNQVAANPDLVRREWRDGFAVGVHTWDHPDMAKLNAKQVQNELNSTLNALHNALGADACIWFWRPPYGSYTAATVQTAAQLGLSTIMWNDDPADWSRPGTQVIVQRVLGEVHPGSIILMHDGPAQREQTLAALPAILDGLRARGLRPVTLPQLLTDGGWPGVHSLDNHSVAVVLGGNGGLSLDGRPPKRLAP